MKVANSIKVRFVVIDTITGNEVTDPFRFEGEAIEVIAELEQNDKEAGCYVADSYKVESVEVI
ncbi:hypothetical protein [Dysgonomonas macrotermitis]|uniref:Uncharacterized protein n=1 Tax=Dysgonomonas macrotermitis TaxID=1346286 RepID=A0A1M5IVR1_9BACT|nr:hypothetical protein [Dysgonomonas macrotermitis]SHG32384.1 hypothetical protein SAMN05444362_12134 [Dysgonomonas macrotermitis]